MPRPLDLVRPAWLAAPLAPLILVAAVVQAATGQAPAEIAPAPPHRTLVDGRTVVPMDTSLVKPSIRVTIDGHGPYRFLLDTGAGPALIINDDLVAELGLRTAPGRRVGDPANPEAIQTVRVPVNRVAIGGAVFERVTALSWDRSALYSGDDAPRGIVGFGLFRDVLLTLDYPRKQVVIEPGALPPADGQGIVEFTQRRGVPRVPITVAGRRWLATLDSGSMATVMLPLAAADELPLVSAPVVVGAGRTVNSEFEIRSATLDGDVTFGPLRLMKPPLEFNDAFEHANIGSALLDRCRLTFDQRHGRLRVETGAEPIEGPVRQRRGSYGLMLDPRAMPPTVLRLVDGSVAARAGLRVGDVIVEIDGTPTDGLLMGDLAKAFRQPSVVLLIERDGTRREIRMSQEPGG